MKTRSAIGIIAISIGFVVTSCNRSSGARYVDLNKGKALELVKDTTTGLLVEVKTKKPVYIYVDRDTRDTIYGSTGKVVNGKIVKAEDGDYRYKGDPEMKASSDEVYDNSEEVNDNRDNEEDKVKVDENGDYKIKTKDKKIKVKDGIRKVKND